MKQEISHHRLMQLNNVLRLDCLDLLDQVAPRLLVTALEKLYGVSVVEDLESHFLSLPGDADLAEATILATVAIASAVLAAAPCA